MRRERWKEVVGRKGEEGGGGKLNTVENSY